MKKGSLLLGMVLVAGIAMAQNTATVTQTGNSEQVTITQSGTDHKADVTQKGGNLNVATVTQNGGNGNRLGAPVATDPGVNVDAPQYGVLDLSLAKGLVQEGNSNTATITQTGNLNIIQQFRMYQSVYNSVWQKGNSNTLDMKQVGNNNVIGQAPHEYQGLNQAQGNGNDAKILQQGNSNKLSYFYQLNDGNKADIKQIGNSNLIESATQAKLANISPTDNSLIILQDGTSNTAALNELGDHIIGDIYQKGASNIARMQLTHSNAYGDIDQKGNSNKADVFVNMSYIGDNNRGVVYQEGDLNTASANIGQRVSSLSSSNNTMEISQVGNSNKASILAEGNNHKAYAEQVGNSNKLVVEQAGGNGNIARLKQSAGAHANILQSGSANTLKGLDSEEWASSLLGSKLDLDQIGTGNTLNLQQTNGGTATVMQNGSSNVATVSQN